MLRAHEEANHEKKKKLNLTIYFHEQLYLAVLDQIVCTYLLDNAFMHLVKGCIATALTTGGIG